LGKNPRPPPFYQNILKKGKSEPEALKKVPKFKRLIKPRKIWKKTLIAGIENDQTLDL